MKRIKIIFSSYICSDEKYAYFKNFKIIENKFPRTFIVISTQNNLVSLKNIVLEERYKDLQLDNFENLGFNSMLGGYLDLRIFTNCKLVNFDNCVSIVDIKFDNRIKFQFINISNNFINNFITCFEKTYGNNYYKIKSIIIINSNINVEASSKLREILKYIPVTIRKSNIIHNWKDNYKFENKFEKFIKSDNVYFKKKNLIN